ncbi:MAG TPA: hypothetical protein VLY24_23360 [Bryobacteraceae bacterium]|nr:hypothetical protein [Bryobacteraceae bacterium]
MERRRLATNTLVLILVGVLAQQACLAQADAWDRVQLIQPGKKVSVQLGSGKTVSGTMEAWGASDLTVRHHKDQIIVLARSDVKKVALVSGMSRGRKATYTGLVAAGALGTLEGAACTRPQRCCGSSACTGPEMVAVAAFWSGVAAGIAALFPQHKEVVYQALSGHQVGILTPVRLLDSSNRHTTTRE